MISRSAATLFMGAMIITSHSFASDSYRETRADEGVLLEACYPGWTEAQQESPNIKSFDELQDLFEGDGLAPTPVTEADGPFTGYCVQRNPLIHNFLMTRKSPVPIDRSALGDVFVDVRAEGQIHSISASAPTSIEINLTGQTGEMLLTGPDLSFLRQPGHMRVRELQCKDNSFFGQHLTGTKLAFEARQVKGTTTLIIRSQDLPSKKAFEYKKYFEESERRFDLFKKSRLNRDQVICILKRTPATS